MRWFLLIAAVFGASGVALGAYHAHGLENMLRAQELSEEAIAKALGFVETGVRYQMYHALALLAVAAFADRCRSRWLTAAGICFTLGVIFFAHPLVLKALAGVSLPWYIVPSGGVLVIAGWLSLAAFAVLRATDSP